MFRMDSRWVSLLPAMFLGVAASAAEVSRVASVEQDLALLYPNEEMVNIATGTVKPIHLAPSVATVITASDIKAMGARTVSEALEFVPGLHVSISWNRHNNIYSIRGIHTDFNPQVLFLINGHSIDEQLTGALPPQFRLSTANVSRIEIIRGPGSAVYGADALAGVINVITKDAAEMAGTTIAGRAGSFDSQDAWLQHGGRYAGWDTAISVDYSSTDGDRSRIIDSDLQKNVLDANPTLGSSASLTPGPASTQHREVRTFIDLSRDHWKLGLFTWHLRDAGVGPGVALALDPVGRDNNDLYSLTADYRNRDFAENLQLEASLGYKRAAIRADFQLFPPGAVLPIATDGNVLNANNPNPLAGYALFSQGLHGNPGGDTDDYFAESALTYRGFLDQQIRLALGFSHDKTVGNSTKNFGPGVLDTSTLSSDPANPTLVDGTLTDVTGTPYSFMPPSSRQVKYLSLQDEWAFARDWELTAGVRYDHYSDFGGTTNPRLALVWATQYNLTTKLLYGRAFRAPSYTELYFINNPSTLGTPDLKPEVLDEVELVFDYRPTFDLQTVFNVFRYNLDGLIDFVNGKAQNVNDQDGYGVEADVSWSVARQLKVVGNYAWQHAENSKTGATIPNAPAQQASVGLRYQATDRCLVSPQAHWVADRARAPGDTRTNISDYTLVDMTLRCDVRSVPMEWAASVRNAFNADAREPAPAVIPNDFPLSGRSVYLELSYHLDQ
jgi:outer membrane receptor for ferrienterochelin and colicins